MGALVGNDMAGIGARGRTEKTLVQEDERFPHIYNGLHFLPMIFDSGLPYRI